MSMEELDRIVRCELLPSAQRQLALNELSRRENRKFGYLYRVWSPRLPFAKENYAAPGL